MATIVCILRCMRLYHSSAERARDMMLVLLAFIFSQQFPVGAVAPAPPGRCPGPGLAPCAATGPCAASCTTAMDVDSVYQLLERILPGERASFSFSFAASPAVGYTVSASGGQVAIVAAGTNELAAGLGWYLREHCNNVIGWPRGGGSHIFKPAGGWPALDTVTRKRIVPWSYAMNVCTHSYSLVW